MIGLKSFPFAVTLCSGCTAYFSFQLSCYFISFSVVVGTDIFVDFLDAIKHYYGGKQKETEKNFF